MAKELPKMSLNTYADLFASEEDRENARHEQIVELQCDEIDGFRDHPYRVRDDGEMDELVESVRQNGVFIPCLVRPKENGRYEMIAGHRRRHAAIRAGIAKIPCIVRDLDDVQATILMVDSNASRLYLLPSEKAFAYKMKLDAMKRQAGRPKNSAPLEPNLKGRRSNEELAAESPDSRAQIQRYIRLTNLLPEILKMVDNSVEKSNDPDALTMAMRPAVELSYLTPESQKIVLDFMTETLSTPSHAQAIQLRKMQDNGILTAQEIYNLLAQEKPNQKSSEKISLSKFSRYFPPNTSAEMIEKEIFKALDFYRRSLEREHKTAQDTPSRNPL